LPDYHGTPSSFSPPIGTISVPGVQSVSFSLPAAPGGGWTTGTITRVYTDSNSVWVEGFSTAGGSAAYDNTSTHQCGFPANLADGLTKTQTVSLTTQQLADLTAAAGTSISCSVNHTSRTSPQNAYSDLYLTLVAGVAPTIVPGSAALVGEAALTAAGAVVVPGAAGLAGVGSLAANGSVLSTTVVPGAAPLSGVDRLSASGVVFAPFPLGVSWSTGYQSFPTTPASAIAETAGSDRFVASGSGSAACTASIDFGAVATIARLDWTDGTAYAYAAAWEYSTDQITWSAVAMPATLAPTGTFAWTSRTITLGSPVTARYWRLSVADSPGGSAVGQAGIRQLTLRNTTGDPVRPVGSYCTNGSFSLSGHWRRYGGVCPHKRAWLTLFYKTCHGPQRMSNAHQYPGTYCSDADLHFVSVQTDCNGAYAFTVPGSVLAAGLAYGKWITNPDYDPLVSLVGMTSDQQARVSSQFLPDPTTAAQYACCGFSGVGTWTYPAGYSGSLPAGGTVTTNTYSVGGTISDAALVGPSYQTGCGDSQTSGVVPQQQSPYLFQVWQPTYNLSYTRSNPLGGAFTLDFNDETSSVASGLLSYITKNGKWYQLANAAYNLVDACGTTESTGYDAATGTSTFSLVDWPNLTSITLTSALPACSFRDGYPSPDNANVLGPQPSPISRQHPPYYYGAALAPLIAGCVGTNFTPIVIIDCNSTPTPLRADVFRGTRTLGVAWTNSTGQLITAVHRSPLAFVGNSGQGWEPNQILEAASASVAGYQYLRNGRAYVDYTLSGAGQYRTNDRQGAGPAAAWSASAGQSLTGAGAAGTSPLEDWRFVLAAGAWYFVVSRDNRGAVWSALTVDSGSAAGTTCGAAWMGAGYGLLYNRASDSRAIFRKTAKGNVWSGASDVDTGSSLTVAGMQQAASGTLVGLLYDPASQRCKACRSRDRGTTWEILSDTPAIPKLSTPPALVKLDSWLLAVWQTGDQAQFAVSVDEGISWI
jgi:hypothetical protein